MINFHHTMTHDSLMERKFSSPSKSKRNENNKSEKKIHDETTEQHRYSNNIIKITAATDAVAVAIVVVARRITFALSNPEKFPFIPSHSLFHCVPLLRIFCLECLCTWHLNLYVFLSPFNLISSNKYRYIVHDVDTVVPRSKSVPCSDTHTLTIRQTYRKLRKNTHRGYPILTIRVHIPRNKIEKCVSVCTRQTVCNTRWNIKKASQQSSMLYCVDGARWTNEQNEWINEWQPNKQQQQQWTQPVAVTQIKACPRIEAVAFGKSDENYINK